MTGEESEPVSVEDVLNALSDFGQFGGASLQLVAWELSRHETVVAAAWSRAISHGYLERAGTDASSGEEMWRLSSRGRDAAAMADEGA